MVFVYWLGMVFGFSLGFDVVMFLDLRLWMSCAVRLLWIVIILWFVVVFCTGYVGRVFTGLLLFACVWRFLVGFNF